MRYQVLAGGFSWPAGQRRAVQVAEQSTPSQPDDLRLDTLRRDAVPAQYLTGLLVGGGQGEQEVLTAQIPDRDLLAGPRTIRG
jgi:hypothetical protein